MARTFSDLAVRFDRLPAELGVSNLKKAAKKVGEFIRKDMERRAPKRTGELAKSIVARVDPGSTVDQVIVRIGPDKRTAWRAHFIEVGVKPHTVKASHSKVLVNRVTGEIFGTSVNHPGMKARPYIAPALEENKVAASKIFADELHQLIMKVFR